MFTKHITTVTTLYFLELLISVQIVIGLISNQKLQLSRSKRSQASSLSFSLITALDCYQWLEPPLFVCYNIVNVC